MAIAKFAGVIVDVKASAVNRVFHYSIPSIWAPCAWDTGCSCRSAAVESKPMLWNWSIRLTWKQPDQADHQDT